MPETENLTWNYSRKTDEMYVISMDIHGLQTMTRSTESKQIRIKGESIPPDKGYSIGYTNRTLPMSVFREFSLIHVLFIRIGFFQ